METVLGKVFEVLFRVPHVNVAKPTLGKLERDVGDQTLGHLWPQPFLDLPVEILVDWDVVRKCEWHVDSLHFHPILLRVKVWGI